MSTLNLTLCTAWVPLLSCLTLIIDGNCIRNFNIAILIMIILWQSFSSGSTERLHWYACMFTTDSHVLIYVHGYKNNSDTLIFMKQKLDILKSYVSITYIKVRYWALAYFPELSLVLSMVLALHYGFYRELPWNYQMNPELARHLHKQEITGFARTLWNTAPKSAPSREQECDTLFHNQHLCRIWKWLDIRHGKCMWERMWIQAGCMVFWVWLCVCGIII